MVSTQHTPKEKPTIGCSPTLIVVSILLAVGLGSVDEDGLAGWWRLAAILGSGIGVCLFTVVAAFAFNCLRRVRPGLVLSTCVWCICLIACCWTVTATVRDLRRAVDPNRWLEIRSESIQLPFTISSNKTYYTLGLNSTDADGLQKVQATGSEDTLWLENSSDATKSRGWWGVLCSVRNTGNRSLINITFDVPISNWVKGTDDFHEIVRHVTIPHLAPNQSINLLLSGERKGTLFIVRKPSQFYTYFEGNPTRQFLRILWMPNKDYWDTQDVLLIHGPN